MSASTPQVHVAPHEGRWSLQQAGKVLSTHDTREDAVEAAHRQAPDGQAEVIVHDADGTADHTTGDPDIPA